MSTSRTTKYYRQRAKAERLCAARTAPRWVAADIHHTLAALYDKLVELEENPTAKLRVVTSEQQSA